MTLTIDFTAVNTALDALIARAAQMQADLASPDNMGWRTALYYDLTALRGCVDEIFIAAGNSVVVSK